MLTPGTLDIVNGTVYLIINVGEELTTNRVSTFQLSSDDGVFFTGERIDRDDSPMFMRTLPDVGP